MRAHRSDWTQLRGRSARRLWRVDGKLQRGQQAGLIVVQPKLAIVQVGDGFDECEPEAGALVGAARVETAEALPRLLPPVERDSGAAVSHFDPDLLLSRPHPHIDLAAARRVADRILDKVADRLRKQLAVAVKRYRPRGRLVVERGAALV